MAENITKRRLEGGRRMEMTGPSALPEYESVVKPLASMLYGLPGKLIIIDGRDGCGKTTLGRYLAWRFNSSLIETDLFLRDMQECLAYRSDEITRLIEKRLAKPRPVFIEGVAILRLLDEMGRIPDFTIYVRNSNYEPDGSLAQMLDDYDAEFRPADRADICITLSVL